MEIESEEIMANPEPPERPEWDYKVEILPCIHNIDINKLLK